MSRNRNKLLALFSVFILNLGALAPLSETLSYADQTTTTSSSTTDSSSHDPTATTETTTTETAEVETTTTSATTETTASSTEIKKPAVKAVRKAQAAAAYEVPPLADSDFAEGYGTADAADPYLYNVVVSGYHSADQADTEGGIAIGKDSTIIPPPNSFNGFNYGAFFDSSASGVGDPLGPRERVALMLGGKLRSYAVTNNGDALTKVGNGLFIIPQSNVDQVYTWPNIQGSATGQIGHLRYLSDSAFQQNLTTMTTEIDRYSTFLSDFTKETVAYQNGSHTVHDDIYVWPEYPKTTTVEQSAEDPGTLVIKIPADSTGLAVMPQINPYDLGIENDQIKRVILTTDAEKVALIGNVLGPNGQPLDINQAHTDPATHDTVVALARKVVYNLPKATQVSNFYLNVNNKVQAAPIDSETGVTNFDTPQDVYDDAYFNQSGMLRGYNALIGAVIAPAATVVWTGASINGYVFAKNFHQRDGAEAHNFYYPNEPNYPSESENHFSAKLYKYVKGNENSPLAGAEFVFARKSKAAADSPYEYLFQNPDEGWSPELAKATRYQTGNNGWLAIENLLKSSTDTYDYYFKETKAPPGYQLQTDWLATVYNAGTSTYVSRISNQEEAAKIPVRLALRKVDDGNNPLEEAVFVLANDQGQQTATSHLQKLTQLPELAEREAAYAVFDQDLAPGSYRLYEKTPPQGYQLGSNSPTEADPWLVTVTEAGELTIKQGSSSIGLAKYLDPTRQVNYFIALQALQNQKSSIMISLAKVDENYHPLPEVKFQLEDKTDPASGKVTQITNEIGLATFTDVQLSHEYHLTESATSSGHDIWRGEYTLKLQNDAKGTPTLLDQNGKPLQINKDFYWNSRTHTLTFLMVNQTMPQVPNTGGQGNQGLYLAGILLVSGGYFIYEMKRRKNNEGK